MMMLHRTRIQTSLEIFNKNNRGQTHFDDFENLQVLELN